MANKIEQAAIARRLSSGRQFLIWSSFFARPSADNPGEDRINLVSALEG